MPKLIRGDKLPATVQAEVLRVYVHRNTREHSYSPSASVNDLVHGPYTDTEWLAAHAFYVTQDGKVLARNYKHCEPAVLAED